MKKNIGIFFLILSILFFAFCLFCNKTTINTSLTDAFIPSDKIEYSNIKNLADKSTNRLNIIFEAENEEELNQIANEFSNKINKFDETFNANTILDIYKNYPNNFLSKEYQNLILNNRFEELSKKSLELLYSPISYYILPPDKDPFLLLTNFVLENKRNSKNIVEYKGKYYSSLNLKIKNNDIKKLYELKNKYNETGQGKIYLTGAPIHSYLTSEKSKIEINIICTISTIFLLLLCFYIFKTFKVAIVIFLSILYGFLFGYSVSTLFFDSIHILTFVFCTSLIGISLDYSLHYFLEENTPVFKKSLTTSLLTTVLTFLLLYLSKIEILKQISIFTTFGLIGTYLYVLFLLPLFNKYKSYKYFKIPTFSNLVKYILLFIMACFIVIGGLNLKFSDEITKLYTPSKNLLEAEKLNSEVFNSSVPEFIIVNGDTVDDILVKEEKLSKELDEKGIDYIALSKFLPSSKQQKVNQKLTKLLYDNHLNKYASFLDSNTVKTIKNTHFKIYNVSFFPLNKEFMLDNNTSFIMLFNKDKINIETIKISKEFSKIIKSVRLECLKLLPFVFIILYAVLLICFGFKKSSKILLPPLIGTLFALGVISILTGAINLFHILALFLIIGFSIDYSIFKINGNPGANSATLISAASTSFSFMLLSFASFKLISSLALVLFIGISASYILSLILIKED